MSVPCIMRWRQYMEDFDIMLKYLEGEQNILADCFSRVPRMEKLTISEKELDNIRRNKGKVIDWKKIQVPTTIDEIFVVDTDISYYMEGDGRRSDDWKPPEECTNVYKVGNSYEAFLSNSEEIHECMLNLPTLHNMNNPTTLINIRNHQQTDERLLNAQQDIPD